LFIRKENKYSENQLNSLIKKNLLIDYKPYENYLDIKTNLTLFLKYIQTDFDLNVETKEKIYLCYDFTQKLNEYLLLKHHQTLDENKELIEFLNQV